MPVCLPVLDSSGVRVYERSSANLVSFPVHIYLNGRLWLRQQLEQAGIAYRRHDNCFTWIEDFGRAQQLMDTQLATPWAELFDRFTLQVHPWFPQLCRNYPMNYYWTCQDSEWAMDLVFRDRQQLQRLYPHWYISA